MADTMDSNGEMWQVESADGWWYASCEAYPAGFDCSDYDILIEEIEDFAFENSKELD